ncbi:Uncharacterised protein [Bartonella doshiae]|uniref:Transmembrane protein n=3 Tax=Bartonella doshiae TaxID=33044 RepID=A0A380ZBK3_BARDO|nr:hypothetical protein MCS_00028 [Bartonella doshiae NCTC 12862 = ATCC 700133]SUV44388.1 Uncharacterised protein [Bartonella doshiae]
MVEISLLSLRKIIEDMIDFVGILKKAINAQSNVTPYVRERIYKRAIETLEQQFAAATIPQAVVDEQRKILQSAIAAVEEEYLAVEKALLSSVIGWKTAGIVKSNKCIQDSMLSQGNDILMAATKESQLSLSSLKNNKEFDAFSVSATPDAEPVNMDTHLTAQHVKKSILKVSPLAPSVQTDNTHIVSHIFSQAVRRANKSSMQRRIIISVAAFVCFIICVVCFCFVAGRVFVLNDHQLLNEHVKASHNLPKEFSINRKLTQRLLEDGSEVDVGLDQESGFSNEEGSSTVVTTNLRSMEQQGEAILYKARTDYEAEKVAMGSAHWTLIKKSRIKGAPEESAIQGDITIPDEGLTLRLILRRNTDLSFPAAYIMDLIFIPSDKFLGRAISNVQTLTFKATEQSIGQALTRTVAAKIDDNFFLVALSDNHPFLDRNLQLIRELDWLRLVLIDKKGRVNELTFAKGPIGESIFNDVIGQWLVQSNQQTILGQKK